MPVWHEVTQQLRDDGKLQIVGIIPEQHPDRCKLFVQWKRMDWPILSDPLNVLGVSAVPLALAVDEQGIVRGVMRSPEEALTGAAFTAGASNEPAGSSGPPDDDDSGAAQGRLARAVDLLYFSSPPRFDEAIRLLGASDPSDPRHAAILFARGVAYRARYDSPQRQPGDFQLAVDHWQAALDRDPNQYIWRRRIQQYGPRLDKPYPFYDWVAQAVAEVRARGETPIELAVEPAGAELAAPAKRLDVTRADQPDPDPDGRITRDSVPLVLVETVVVPPRIRPGEAARVHVVFRPDPHHDGHWNNEAKPLECWLRTPAGWASNSSRAVLSGPPTPVSDEMRTVEFELRAPADAASGPVEIPAYALYYVCEGSAGRCLYRRQDVLVRIDVRTNRP